MDRKNTSGFGRLFRRRGVALACCLGIFAFVVFWQIGFAFRKWTTDDAVRPHIFDKLQFLNRSDSVPAGPIVEALNRRVGLMGIQGLDQRSKTLIRLVRLNLIKPPSVLEYSFGRDAVLKYIDPEVDNVVYPLFKNKTNGFFVEVGAYDGIYSHTLILERDYKWNGLLIECYPELLPKLRSVNRKAYIADACLSKTNHPAKTRMTSMDNWLASSSLGTGNLYPNWIKSNYTAFEVQTIPLYSIIASIDIAEVDLIVLDVQSLELEVLKYFPFELIHVKVWLVEIYFYSAEQRDALMTFMAQKGYPKNRIVKLTNDYVFVHDSLQ